MKNTTKLSEMSNCVVKVLNKDDCIFTETFPVNDDLKNITSNLLIMKEAVNNFLTSLIELNQEANVIDNKSDSDEGKL